MKNSFIKTVPDLVALFGEIRQGVESGHFYSVTYKEMET